MLKRFRKFSNIRNLRTNLNSNLRYFANYYTKKFNESKILEILKEKRNDSSVQALFSKINLGRLFELNF